MTKGFIFKYSADSDLLMRDKLGTTSVYGRGLRDPDYWSNDYPVWAICGPYFRQALEREDVVFFVPKQTAIRNAMLDDYICTGILVVKEKLDSSKAVMLDRRLTEEYKKRYRVDLAEHLENDKEKTKKIRPHNFVFGDSTKSEWLGRNEKYLGTLVQELCIKSAFGKLSLRRIPLLKEQEVKSLYQKLTSKKL